MRAKRLLVALGAVALLGGWSGVGEADDETPEHLCAPDGEGGWERHDNVSPEEAGELAERGGFEIDENNPCPPEEQTQGLGNLCAEQPQHPACNPDETKVPNSNEPCRKGSRVHCIRSPHPHHHPHKHPEPKVVETPRGGVDTGGWPEAEQRSWTFPGVIGGITLAVLLLVVGVHVFARRHGGDRG